MSYHVRGRRPGARSTETASACASSVEAPAARAAAATGEQGRWMSVGHTSKLRASGPKSRESPELRNTGEALAQVGRSTHCSRARWAPNRGGVDSSGTDCWKDALYGELYEAKCFWRAAPERTAEEKTREEGEGAGRRNTSGTQQRAMDQHVMLETNANVMYRRSEDEKGLTVEASDG